MLRLLILGVTVVALIVVTALRIADSPGFSEKRAYEGMALYIAGNGLIVSRQTCASDSDGDGYGSCSLVTEDGESINLQCPTKFLRTVLFGARSCKQIFQPMKITR